MKRQCCICKILMQFFFFWTVFAMDLLDSSSVSQAELPHFQEIKEVYSKELESSVIFPDLFMRPAGSRGTCYTHSLLEENLILLKEHSSVFLKPDLYLPHLYCIHFHGSFTKLIYNESIKAVVGT